MKAFVFALLFCLPVMASEHMFHEPPDIQKAEPDPAFTTRPAAPKMQSPASLATIDSTDVNLVWEAVPGADFYNVELATDPGFFYNVINERAYKSTQVSAHGLQPGTHYFWRVAAVTAHNFPSYNKGPFASASFSTPGAQ